MTFTNILAFIANIFIHYLTVNGSISRSNKLKKNKTVRKINNLVLKISN